MLKIATKTKLSLEETIKRAVEFFSPGVGIGWRSGNSNLIALTLREVAAELRLPPVFDRETSNE